MSRLLTTTPGETAASGRVEAPGTLTEVSALLGGTTGTLLVRGAATKLDWAGRVTDPDLVVDTAALQGMLTHNPADMTASVRAGTPLQVLQETLAEEGQWLALDPPSASVGATVGGLLAAGDSGPSRLRYGGLRDLVIGVTLVLADGTLARAGSHVIKNVAGYDLSKLVHGSLGSLAVIAEVIVRLHPRPPASATAVGPADAAQATAATLALAASPLEPTAVEWVSGDGTETGQLHVRVDGTTASTEAASRGVADLLAGLGIPTEVLSEPAVDAAWKAHATAVLGTDDETVVRVAGLPSDLDALARHVSEAAAQAGVGARLISSAALGMHTVRLDGGSAQAHAHVLTGLRTYARARDASVLLRQRPAALDDLVDALGPPPSSIELLRRVKAQFDPTGRFAPGRFRPWY